MDILKDQKLRTAAQVLKQEFNAKRIFLFGSKARGTSHQYSDYDFMVIVEKTDLDTAENMIKGRRALRPYNIPADIFVYSEVDFENAKKEFSSLAEEVANTGMEIALE